MSHELRTPLTAIRGYASSLLASDVTWDDESKTRFLNRIASESARMGSLVGDLLDFSAIESGLLASSRTGATSRLVLEAAVSCLPPEASAAVIVDCDPAIGPVWADHDRLEQVFVNLLENAFRHNPPGVHVTVDVSLQPAGTVAIRVRDDGCGIAPELAAHIFEARARGHERSTGAGLGLSIARGIVLAHGGEISLEKSEQDVFPGPFTGRRSGGKCLTKGGAPKRFWSKMTRISSTWSVATWPCAVSTPASRWMGHGRSSWSRPNHPTSCCWT